MITVEWVEDLRITIFSENDVEDLQWDWQNWLAGENLQSVTVTLSDGVTAGIPTTAGTLTSVRVSAFQAPVVKLSLKATSSTGRVADRAVIIDVK